MIAKSALFLCVVFVYMLPGFCLAQTTIKQETTGEGSHNVYISGNSGTINIDGSDKATIRALEQLKKELRKQGKGRERILDHFEEDIRLMNMQLEQKDQLLKDLVQTFKILSNQVTERFASTATDKKINPLKAIDHFDFIEKSVPVFGAYLYYKKTLELLNPDMLIELLRLYFRSVLLYPSDKKTEYYVTARSGALYKATMEGHNERGDKILISLAEISSSLLQNVCADFIKSANPRHYETIVDLFHQALSTPELGLVIKMNVLDAENFIVRRYILFGSNQKTFDLENAIEGVPEGLSSK